MREELGDQWIEIINGQKHMVKAVTPIELCKGCLDIASRMFPTHIDTIKKQKDGDGILIAEYARLKNL